MEESPQAISGPHLPYHRECLCLLCVQCDSHMSEVVTLNGMTWSLYQAQPDARRQQQHLNSLI